MDLQFFFPYFFSTYINNQIQHDIDQRLPIRNEKI